MFMFISHILSLSHLQNFTKKGLVWGFRADPDLAISRTKFVAVSPRARSYAKKRAGLARLSVKFNRRFSMKLATAIYTAALTLAPVIGLANDSELPPNNPNSTTFTFPLTVSPGAKACLKDAEGVVIDHTFGNVENLEVIVSGLPPNTDFVLFIIQVPNAPFGLAWYNGDILTDDTGTGVINVVGRFNIGTFIVSLGAVPSPDVFPSPPAVLANSKTGAVTNGPVQLYHLGLWFNSPHDAAHACRPRISATFTSNHDAGIQVLNTATFPDAQGPLFNVR